MKHPDALFGRMGNRMFQMAAIYGLMFDGKFPDTYLQSEKYWSAHADTIKDLFSDGINPIPTPQVAIHVRRGTNPSDSNEPPYAENPFYANLFEDHYYERAMQQFSEDTTFLVFSDDIEWCKRNPIFAGCLFSEGRNEVDDLNYMASCQGHIIANSSYSWWGAYLSPHTKKVIAPKKWYADGIDRTDLPDNWIRI